MIRPGLIAVFLLGAGLACGGGGDSVGPATPDPGPVDLVLATPNVNDGGLLISIAGGPVTTVVPQAYQVAMSAPGSNGVSLIVRGNIVAGVVAQITIPDRNHLGSYSAVIVQASARTYQQQSLAGYTLTLRKP